MAKSLCEQSTYVNYRTQCGQSYNCACGSLIRFSLIKAERAGRRLFGKIVHLCREIFSDALRKKANRAPPGEHRLLSKFHWPQGGLITALGGNGQSTNRTLTKRKLFNLLISILFAKT
ncbi:hypothetical protein T02_13764 [Trichinella nativa]|uniref:Uncharacterized protein n=1 Tax=Trichinella nativa TaxID=6335 RepID=A0A0V1L6S8_9BILA|nr:hypothetical protein T02_13764 [Trichinella nativa]